MKDKTCDTCRWKYMNTRTLGQDVRDSSYNLVSTGNTVIEFLCNNADSKYYMKKVEHIDFGGGSCPFWEEFS